LAPEITIISGILERAKQPEAPHLHYHSATRIRVRRKKRIMAVKKKAKKKAVKTRAKKSVKRPVRTSAKKTAKKKTAKKTVKKKTAKRTIKQAVKKAAKKTASVKAASTAPAKMSAAVTKRKDMLKGLLLKKRNEVVHGLEAQMGRKLTLETGQKIDSAMDSADQSSQDVDQGIDYSLLEMKYEQYKDIADAFRKLQNNTYGVCEECGGEISIKRLEVNPLARYCIECKTRKEEMEKIQREETRFKE
jgi:DnaK suppressor protein